MAVKVTVTGTGMVTVIERGDEKENERGIATAAVVAPQAVTVVAIVALTVTVSAAATVNVAAAVTATVILHYC